MSQLMNGTIFPKLDSLRNAGQKEYAHAEENAFANFERVGEHLGIPREKVLSVYMLKHLDGVMAYLNGHTSQREDVRGRISDLMVYLCLLWGMIEENENKEN